MSNAANLSFFYQPITDTSSQSTSLVKDSDEIFEMHCETCKRDGTYVTASAFCTCCVAYLCNTCLKYHGKFLPDHKYLEKDDMPQDVCTETCAFHKGELIKFYCVTCDKFACSICKTKDHTINCSMKYLPDFVKDLENCNDFKEIITSSTEILQHISASQGMVYIKHEHISNIFEEVTCVINRKKDYIFSRFDKEACELKQQIQSVKNFEKQRVDDVTGKFIPLKSEIDKLLFGVKEISKSPKHRKYKLFIAMKQIRHDLKQMEGSVRDLANHLHSSDDSFKTELRDHAHDLIQRVENVGKNTNVYDVKTVEKHRKFASAVGTINVNDLSDTKDCYIVNCCLLSERYLIACDKNNRSIKLVDTKVREVVYFRRVKTFPDAVTRISDTRMAMVQAFDKNELRSIIQFLMVTSAKVLEFEVAYLLTEMRCMDILYLPHDKLVISMSENHMGKVQILNMSGSVLANIETKNDEKVFKCPFYITLNSEMSKLFVSDWYRDSITELDLVNKSIRALDYRFWHPEGITVDEEGYIYVCESGTKRICVFRPDDQDTNILLDKESDQWEPLSLCYSCTDKMLYIGQDSLNCMKVYRIVDNDFPKLGTLA